MSGSRVPASSFFRSSTIHFTSIDVTTIGLHPRMRALQRPPACDGFAIDWLPAEGASTNVVNVGENGSGHCRCRRSDGLILREADTAVREG